MRDNLSIPSGGMKGAFLDHTRLPIYESTESLNANISASKPKKHVYILLTVIFVTTAAASAAYIAWYAYQHFTFAGMNRNILSLYEAVEPFTLSSLETAATEDIPQTIFDEKIISDETPRTLPVLKTLLRAEEEGRKRFTALLEVNADFLGMVIIEGLGVTLPFVRAEDNEKYLYTDFEGNQSKYGTVFLSSDNARLLTDKNIVLFGHYMKTGAMFAPLLKYRVVKNIPEALVIIVDSLTGKTKWLVFAAYVCEPDSGYVNTRFIGDGFTEMLTEIQSRSFFHTNVDVNEYDQILTLSTCAPDFTDARFAVHARKLRPGEEIFEIIAVTNTEQKPYTTYAERNLSELAANRTGIMQHPGSQKMYYYQAGAKGKGLEWYIGNTSQIQGPYSGYTGTARDCGIVSAIYNPSGDNILLAAERFNGKKGIALLSNNTVSGPFNLVKNPATPSGADAKNPLLIKDDKGVIWLLYTVASDMERLYRMRLDIRGEVMEAEVLAAAPKGAGVKPVGMVWHEGQAVLIWQEAAEKVLYGKYFPDGEPVVLSIPGDADRVTLYGEPAEGIMTYISEKKGQLRAGSFNINEIPRAPGQEQTFPRDASEPLNE